MARVFVGIDIGGTSIKAVATDGTRSLWQRQSRFYHRPDRQTLHDALVQVLSPQVERAQAFGLCVPGLPDESGRRIVLSLNAPGLNGADLDQMLAGAIGVSYRPARIINDAVAAGLDMIAARKPAGRVMVIAMGTGIGAAVFDDAKPLFVEGASPGHIGQLDVSIEQNPVVGPDGGIGGLEGYAGAAAIKLRYGDDLDQAFARLNGDEPFLRALARAIRIAHAIYRPHHILLCGGVGVRLRPALPLLDALVRRGLTSVAREHWTLCTGDHDFHSALGAARAAGNHLPLP